MDHINILINGAKMSSGFLEESYAAIDKEVIIIEKRNHRSTSPNRLF